MNKIKIGPDALIFPMPAVLVGCRAQADLSFAAIAWSGVVNSSPPMLGVGIRKSRFTHQLIAESGVFSVNVPSAKQAVETDFCGIVSGRNVDKVKACGFTVFYGTLQNAPLIEECPVNIECSVEKVVELPSHDYFIGKIVEIHMDQDVSGGDGPAYAKIDPLVFMSTHYARVTGNLGRAFSIGRQLKEK
ncbi:MAG: flavin reductase family protein [Spirochaetales bacterium]|nr:flavin reductase family protein [Spirochaetales bacterium]